MFTCRLAFGGPKNIQMRSMGYGPDGLPNHTFCSYEDQNEPTHDANGVPVVGKRPAMLVSYYYAKNWKRACKELSYRDWVLDSGAFSAHNSGVDIKLQDYIDFCKKEMDEDPNLKEVFALDDLTSWKITLKNTEEMWKQGIPAIPCYHSGEPEHVLRTIASNYPKIALGGAVGMSNRPKLKWAEACFGVVWPKRIHGFGFGSENHMLSLPWDSCDATNWMVGPCQFGKWAGYRSGKRWTHLSIRGSETVDLSSEIDFYMNIEHRCRQKWGKVLSALED